MAGEFPTDLRYSTSDEWVRREGDEAVCGITAFAADQLGDIVYVQLSEVGKRVAVDAPFGEVESVKAVSDLVSPLTGEVLAVNGELDQNPGLVNEDPYGRGWMIRLRLENPAEYDGLLDSASYLQSTAERP